MQPTAVLTPQEARRLFEILENLRRDGKSIVFISHKLDEVMEISDRISVMRQGQYIGTVDKKDTSPRELAKMMMRPGGFPEYRAESCQGRRCGAEGGEPVDIGRKGDLQDPGH